MIIVNGRVTRFECPKALPFEVALRPILRDWLDDNNMSLEIYSVPGFAVVKIADSDPDSYDLTGYVVVVSSSRMRALYELGMYLRQFSRHS